eukprot:COSAG02_NODE_862_length_16418_cov_5.730621_17_plen_80_part_00
MAVQQPVGGSNRSGRSNLDASSHARATGGVEACRNPKQLSTDLLRLRQALRARFDGTMRRCNTANTLEIVGQRAAMQRT